MPTASRQVRKVRRMKRERTLAFRSLNQMIHQFESVRAYALGLKQELDLRDAAKEIPKAEDVGRELPPNPPQEGV